MCPNAIGGRILLTVPTRRRPAGTARDALGECDSLSCQRTFVRMTPDELDQVARLVGIYRSTVNVMPHPVDDFDGWRRRWDQLGLLTDEINALLRSVGAS